MSISKALSVTQVPCHTGALSHRCPECHTGALSVTQAPVPIAQKERTSSPGQTIIQLQEAESNPMPESSRRECKSRIHCSQESDLCALLAHYALRTFAGS